MNLLREPILRLRCSPYGCTATATRRNLGPLATVPSHLVKPAASVSRRTNTPDPLETLPHGRDEQRRREPVRAGIDLSQFFQVFFEEAGENLQTMEQMLLELDVAPPTTRN